MLLMNGVRRAGEADWGRERVEEEARRRRLRFDVVAWLLIGTYEGRHINMAKQYVSTADGNVVDNNGSRSAPPCGAARIK